MNDYTTLTQELVRRLVARNMSSATTKSYDWKVYRTAPVHVNIAVLSSGHMRSFILAAMLASACWYIQGVLYNSCDTETSADYVTRHVTTVFSNNVAAADRVNTAYLNSISCYNASAGTAYRAYKTYSLTAVNAELSLRWYEQDSLRCLRDDPHGREEIHAKVIGFAVLIVVAAITALVGLCVRMTTHASKHLLMSLVLTIAWIVLIGGVLGGLWAIQENIFYPYEDDGLRNVTSAVWWMSLLKYILAVGGACYGLCYFIALWVTGRFYMGVSDGTLPSPVKGASGVDNLTSGKSDFMTDSQRRVRADTMLTMHRHELLKYAIVFSVLSIIMFAAHDTHAKDLGTVPNQIIHGEGFHSLTGGSNTVVCEQYKPFKINATLYNTHISTQHFIKHFLRDHGKGSISLLVMMSIFIVLEVVISLGTYLRTTTALFDQMKKDTTPTWDIFASIIPLSGQLVETAFTAAPVAVLGFVLLYYFQISKDVALHGLEKATFAAAFMLTISVAINYFLFAVYANHMFFTKSSAKSVS